MRDIEVLVVDDSSFFRNTFRKILAKDNIKVVGTARDGKEAIDKTLELKPSIITMDVEMPVMNGLESLKEIMKVYPTPVLMVSSLTSDGADATITALNRGAIDFVTKKSGFGEMHGMKTEIISKINAICNNNNLVSSFDSRRRIAQKISSGSDKTENSEEEIQIIKRLRISRKIEAIGIGVSTGGPQALKKLFSELGKGFKVPIFVTQHMPPKFTKSLATRLNRECGHDIKEAEDGELVRGGNIYIAPGGKHLTISPTRKIKLSDEPSDVLYRPSVDVMFDSIINSYGEKTIGIMLTGMGHDGAMGINRLHTSGGYVIAQSPLSCVVSGMVESCLKKNAVDMIAPIDKIPEVLNSHFGL